MNRTPLDSFESALLTELRQHVERHPVTPPAPVQPIPLAPHRRRRVRQAAAAAGVGIAATVATVVGVGSLGGPSPAYAVEKDSGGDVVVTIHRLDDAAGLEQALAADGIDADVTYAPDGLGRQAGAGQPDPQPGGALSLQRQRGDSDGPTLSGDPSDACGAPGTPPATLRHDGGDWVLTVPAGSVLLDRHVQIGTDADGSLLVQYAGTQPHSSCGVMTAAR